MVRKSMLTVGVLTLLAVLGRERPAAAQATIGGDWRADVADLAQRVVDADLTPGVGVAVAAGDWVVYEQGFGDADLRTGRKVTPSTPFYIASTTKSLTATAVVLAAERGDLDLDAPMVRYLPDARLADGVDPRTVTVRSLLTMTHGLSGDGPVTLRTAYTGQFTGSELLELLRFHAPTGDQGSFDYNNLGYNLLGMVLESVYDDSWKETVARLVLRPIGMAHTSAYRSRYAADRLALPHDFGGSGFEPVPLAKDDRNLHAAGGHFATAGDLARYLAAHQSEGVVEGESVMPAAALRSTHRVYVSQDREVGPFHRHGWGYGWDVGTYDGDTLLHRFGGFQGYSSHMSFMPEHGIGVVVLVNGDGPGALVTDLLSTYIYDRLRGETGVEDRYRAQVDALAARAAEAQENAASHDRERAARLAPLRRPLDAYAGIYESPVLGRMEWRVIAGGLEMRMGVVHTRAEVYSAADDQLRVEIAGGGQVAAFEFGEGDSRAESVSVAGVRFQRLVRAR